MKEPFRPVMTELAAKVLQNEADRFECIIRKAKKVYEKISDEQVLEIRASKLAIQEIAIKYGITVPYAYVVRVGHKRQKAGILCERQRHTS